METAINHTEAIRAAVFDLDGTLAYTLPDITDAMNLAMTGVGCPAVTMGTVLEHISEAVPRFVSLCLPPSSSDDTIQSAIEIYQKSYERLCLNKTRLYDGLLELLKKLKGEGFKLGVLTNKTHRHAVTITETLCPGIFDAVVGYTDALPSKPAPPMAEKLLEMLSVSRDEVFYFGDSGVDVETIKNCGFSGAAVTWGYCEREELLKLGAPAVVDNADEIYSLLHWNTDK